MERLQMGMSTRHRPHLLRAVAFAVLCTALPGAALAWNKAGHMTSAAIAYDDLAARDPALVSRVVALLRQHPQFDQRWKTAVDGPDVTPEEANRRLFMLAARWPDDVRGDSDFDHPEDHFIDLPYRPPGQPPSVKGGTVPTENLVTAYADHLRTLKTSADEAQRAVALCWILHLTGDVHQPLHSVSLFTTKFTLPDGDRGGTRFYVRVQQSAPTISLHSLWDGLVLGSERYKAVADTATELRLRQGFARADLPELAKHPFSLAAADKWARQESFPIAKSVAYLDGKLKSGSKSNGVVLPGAYVAAAKLTAERRMVLSGYRIADAMRAVFARP